MQQAVSHREARARHLASPLRPFVSIVVPCRNEARYVGAMLESILATAYPSDRYEIVIVDGMSDDGTRAVLTDYASRYPAITVLDNPMCATPHALNIGIRRARGTIIVRMDVHAHYPSHYVSELVDWLERTNADNVGGACVTLPGGETTIAHAIAAAMAHPFGIGNARHRLGTAGPRDVDTVPFGCFRRSLFDRVGLFDEDLARSQDSEFNFRLRRAGGRVVLVPGVATYYYARESLAKLWRMFFQYGYFKPLVARKVGAVMTGRQLVPALFVSTVLGSAGLAPWSGAALVLLLLVLGTYALADLTVAATLAPRKGVRVALASTIVFPTLHFAFGIGYLLGTLDFVIRRRNTAAARLSR